MTFDLLFENGNGENVLRTFAKIERLEIISYLEALRDG